MSRIEDGTRFVVCFNSLKHIESYEDLVVLFERLRPHMHTIFIGADRGVEEAVLRHQKHMQVHV